MKNNLKKVKEGKCTLEDFEVELRAICKNCDHQPTKDFYSCHTCHEINPKEILKDEEGEGWIKCSYVELKLVDECPCLHLGKCEHPYKQEIWGE